METNNKHIGASAGRLKKSMTFTALSLALLGSTTGTQAVMAFASEAPDTTDTAQVNQIEADSTKENQDQLLGPSALDLDHGPFLAAELREAVDGTLNLDVLTDKLDSKTQALRTENMISFAESLLGVPYVYGGTSPSGFDCSGFTQYVMRNSYGIELPRTAAAQSGLGTYIPMSQAQRGDLIFWGSGGGVYHTGIYLGDGMYIHAGTSSGKICIQSCEYFTPSFAKRIL